MSKNLVIVESPAKAKTIEKYLGKDFTVRSSYGHIRDLPKGDKAIDIENDFTPVYEVSSDKKEVIKELNKEVKDAEYIWLATDDDREGEAISWHLYETLKLNNDNTKRIVFREITKSAILKAIDSPRTIDIDLVNAQQARRILDRLVGYELSPVLWKKIKRGLSAGRVQSVAVRLVVEREREVEAFTPESSFKVVAEFDLDQGKVLKAELPKKFKTEEEARVFLEACLKGEYQIADLQKKPGKRTPAAPFTTSTLQQEASRKLGYSVSQTMILAQKLYESGKITYMRTDSVNISEEAKAAAADVISSTYGEEYVETRHFKTKSKSAQEAHEAIRPTNFSIPSVNDVDDNREARLYELIWKRAIASQMSNARLEKTIAKISVSTAEEQFTASGEVIVFDGFLKVYIESKDEDDADNDGDSSMLPPLSVGQSLALSQMDAIQRFTRPAARYTEASLVKKLEEMGIGRPSTYAPTISTIQKRDYVVKEARDGKERKYRHLRLKDGAIKDTDQTEIVGNEKNKLFPTNIGMVVNDFLVKYFPDIVDYSFTAQVEEQFDEIANGGKEWNSMIKNFYGSFHETVETTTEKADRSEIGGSRVLGTDPVSGKEVTVRLGKFGPIAQIGTTPEEGDEEAEKPKYASLRKGQYLESITLEDALELFKLPRTVGEFEDKVVVAAIGRFGPYIRHDGKFVSIGKELAPETITLDEAIALILAKREADAKKFIKAFDEDPEIQILNGRWGPYISYKKKNYKIPKETEASELTFEETMKLIEEGMKAPAKKKGAAAKKTTAAEKKTTATKAKTTTKKTTTKKATTAKKTTATKRKTVAKK
ncbi:type I DNA topoisomerase [Sediminitomix flava]|uniref:DNA topoisomerase 1 n=1 Tax=Sediminitomix flava TaxID=379075 RepID=A0A315Z9D8_SEDFL|nr:type I DNA topoisomerase [Sediminitomix flava]PWJ42166.1 DNA topoisomerase I [Sediminitomix flava]